MERESSGQGTGGEGGTRGIPGEKGDTSAEKQGTWGKGSGG